MTNDEPAYEEVAEEINDIVEEMIKETKGSFATYYKSLNEEFKEKMFIFLTNMLNHRDNELYKSQLREIREA